MLSRELQKRQWATPAEPEILSQIVICLFLHADICNITFFCYVRPVTKENVIFFIKMPIFLLFGKIGRINEDMKLILYSPE